ncbi:hypothetical protein BSKO_07292 [Bryopsis sp. KO-2023]|nr:hypothetical protein BSKO_07292 [Bryopsis sp. KO-2023]
MLARSSARFATSNHLHQVSQVIGPFWVSNLLSLHEFSGGVDSWNSGKSWGEGRHSSSAADGGIGMEPGSNSNSQVRVLTYNVLSSSLAPPDYFTHCKPEDLKAETRLKRVIQKLKPEVEAKSIICLQEVSLQWAGRFSSFFHKHGYFFLQTQYGGHWSDFMGVGVAFPLNRYSMKDCEMLRLTDLVKWRREPRKSNPIGWLTGIPGALLNKVGISLRVSNPLSFLGKTPEDWLQKAKYRSNRIVMLKLDCKETKRTFLVGTYHMPCEFRRPKVMLTHAALAAQFMESRSNGDPYLLVGDWNFKPGEPPYNLLTTLDAGMDADLPPHETWKPELKNRLKSAYKECLGSEPEFTNNAQIRDDPPFVGTLDYIFTSENWKVEDVGELPKEATIDGPYPNENEPSDHTMLRATFEGVPTC